MIKKTACGLQQEGCCTTSDFTPFGSTSRCSTSRPLIGRRLVKCGSTDRPCSCPYPSSRTVFRASLICCPPIPGTLLVGTYAVFAYQLLFAVVIWIKPVRKPFLLFGLLFHLSIVFIVGLADFGLFMIASYSIFLAPADARKLMERLSVVRLKRKQ